MALDREAFGFGLRPPEGGWLTLGQVRPGIAVHWWTNPRLLLPRAWTMVVGMWRQSQGGMARGWLPEAGGTRAQPAWLMEAFAILSAEEQRLDRKKERGR